MEEGEHKRIIANGGQIYQTKTLSSGNQGEEYEELGPPRVLPGRLSVSRAFGDIHAKSAKYNGIPGVIVATPDIFSFQIENHFDFIILGCDGIFDRLESDETIKIAWESAKKFISGGDLHFRAGKVVDNILSAAAERQSMDNLTSILVAFEGFTLNTAHQNLMQNLSTSTLSLNIFIYF